MIYFNIINELIKEGILKKNKLVPRYRSMIETRPDLLKKIIFKTNFLNKTALLKERMFCIINNVIEPSTCKSQHCDNKLQYKQNRYYDYCSYKCANSSEEKIQNTKNTCFEKYGVESVKQLKETNEKYKQTCFEKYGVEHTSKLKETKEKYKQTCFEKYGVKSTLLLNKSIIAAKKKRKEKYGDESYKRSLISTISLYTLNNKETLIKMNTSKTLKEISNKLGVSDQTVGNYFKKFNIEVKRFNSSAAEKEVNKFIISLNIKTILGSYKIIPPYQLDIYIPEYNIAIEYNGLFWHSEQVGKDKHYHKKKYDLCKEQGIQLITIFEDEWRDYNKQVKNKLRSLLYQNNSKKIYGRKTNIITVSKQDKRQFFNNNHIQGDGPSSINIGLIDNKNDEIVAVMGFIKNKNKKYELRRYATNYQVLGGFSKLLKYFINKYKPNIIISFADLRWSNGNLYFKTGWEIDKILPPDYTYSPNGKNRIHKFNYRRKNLDKLLNNYDPILSENQNCYNNRILKIWDCGKIKFILKLN